METQEMQTDIQSGLEVFFKTMLQELYWCEQHLVNVLESMQIRASTDRLKEVFNAHREETYNQAGRLEKIFSLLGMKQQPLHCTGMQGLFDEGWQVIDETAEGSAHRDAALIVAAQKVEHYEIASYGSLITLALTLGFKDSADLLEMTLAEEKEADGKLTALAMDAINQEASTEAVSDTQSQVWESDATVPGPDAEPVTAKRRKKANASDVPAAGKGNSRRAKSS